MKPLTQTMRWYGPADPVTLADIRQAGAVGVVSALHDVPNGEVWSVEAITAHRRLIEEVGLEWRVVESVPVHEDIKRRAGDYARYIDNYKQCLRNLAQAGIEVVTYNFMPVCDWTRTDLSYGLPDGSRALRFDAVEFAAFELYLLEREGAEAAYSAEVRAFAKTRYDAMDPAERRRLVDNVIAGLPGGTTAGAATLGGFRESLKTYDGVDGDASRQNLHAFVGEIAPVAEEAGVRLAIHPDDPPFPILGLPRVMSTADDVAALLEAVPVAANGLCFCTGSFGVSPDNDLPAMAERFGESIHFVHLRSTAREPDGSFYEADHLAGDVDMPAVTRALMTAAARRDTALPMRPDHGHQMLDDLDKKTNPGYSAIGRLRGLAELRGLMVGLRHAAMLCVLILLVGCSEVSDTKTIYLAHTLPTVHPVHKGIEVFAEELYERSGGTLQVKVFPDGQLGSERETLELLQIGSIQMAKVSSAVMANFVDDYEVLGVPYLFRDEDHLFRVLDGEIGQQILESGSEQLLRGVAFYNAGARSFYTVDRPVRTPQDLAGMKVRVMNHRLSLEMVNALGGAATPMAFGELYTALQQGVVDGAENNAPSLVASGHYQVVNYYALDEHAAMPDVLMASARLYDDFSAEERAWVEAAARESTLAQRRFWTEDVAAAMATVREAGVEVIEVDKAPFREGVTAVVEGFATTPERRALVEQIRTL